MVILGAALNHWYHSDMIYRGIINLLVMCGCIGQSGGGWAHYVGQEKLRPQSGWIPLAFATDWNRPPRQMNSTSFWYAHTDQWRYEKLQVPSCCRRPRPKAMTRRADRLQRPRRAHGLAALRAAAGANPLRHRRRGGEGGMRRPQYVAQSLKDGTLSMSCEDPENPANWPRNLFVWRSNLLGSSARGTSISSSTCSARSTACRARTSARRAVKPRRPPGTTRRRKGKLDLLVTLDFRMSTTCMYSDIVLPTATWYEKHDLNTSDMHPFIHPLSAAVDPAWESRTDWAIFKGIAKRFSDGDRPSRRREGHVVLTPLMHDTPASSRQTHVVRDWKKGECEPDPRQDHAGGAVVERDYPNTYARFTALGPLMDKLGNNGKGMAWKTEHEVEFLGQPERHGRGARRRGQAPRRSRPTSTPAR
jgi:nitrate reductase / nitrite oxidoreductase, alpha subunit